METPLLSISDSEQIGFDQGSVKEDCAPWVPATHPDGALYFYDRDRVRVSGLLRIMNCDPPAFKEAIHRHRHARPCVKGGNRRFLQLLTEDFGSRANSHSIQEV